MKADRRPFLTTDICVDLAMRRFTVDSRGRLRTITEISNETKFPLATVSRAIARAFKNGLVSIKPTGAPEPRRVRSLEDSLLREFERLRGALVIETDNSQRYQESTSSELDDRRHELIGGGLADVIATDMFFRDDDRIGLGSGRGVYHSIAPLSGRSPSRAKRIGIISLTGSVDARDYSQRMSLRLEADTHARLLAACFSDEPSLHLIKSPIAFASPVALAEQRTSTPIGDANWRSHTPTRAIVGVGVFAKGHRLHDEAEAKGESRNQILAPIAELCVRLKQLCSAMTFVKDYCPVADLCNRLFRVPAPPEVKIDSNIDVEIAAMISEINSRLLTVSEKQLVDINSVILVAAGRQKALAIKHLLRSSDYQIQFLATDRETAELIKS